MLDRRHFTSHPTSADGTTAQSFAPFRASNIQIPPFPAQRARRALPLMPHISGHATFRATPPLACSRVGRFDTTCLPFRFISLTLYHTPPHLPASPHLPLFAAALPVPHWFRLPLAALPGCCCVAYHANTRRLTCQPVPAACACLLLHSCLPNNAPPPHYRGRTYHFHSGYLFSFLLPTLVSRASNRHCVFCRR